MRIIGKDNGQHVVDIDGEVKHLNDAELDELLISLGLPPRSEPVEAPAEAASVTVDVSLVDLIKEFAAGSDNVTPETEAALKLLRDALIDRYPYELDEALDMALEHPEATPESLLEALIVTLPADPAELTDKAKEYLQALGKLGAPPEPTTEATPEPLADKTEAPATAPAETSKPAKTEKGGK